MTDTLTAEKLLSIPLDQPERLFPSSEKEAKTVRKNLLDKWHPDKSSNADANKVTEHIVKLYDEAIRRIQAGSWIHPNEIAFSGEDGKVRTIKFKRKRSFELGEMYYADSVLCYAIKSQHRDLFDNGLKTIKKSFTFASDNMKEEISKYLPAPLDNFKTKDGDNILVLAKTKDVFLLQDVLDFYDEAIDPRHVAWIINSLYNQLCYFNYLGLTHNAISTTNCFISPKHHASMIYGGWWYSRPVGKKLIALPRRSADAAPVEMINSKIASPKLDLILIRQLGLELLGDESGINLLHDKNKPQPMIKFLRGIACSSAVQDYDYWIKKALPESFGKRRFVEMKIEASDIYGSV